MTKLEENHNSPFRTDVVQILHPHVPLSLNKLPTQKVQNIGKRRQVRPREQKPESTNETQVPRASAT